MEEKKTFAQDTPGVELERAIRVLCQKMWIIVLAAVLGAVLSVLATFFFITPQYESSVLFYVNNNSFSLGETSLSIDSGDISASKSLVDSYIVILNARESLNEVIRYAGVERSYTELKDMITASSVNGTEIFKVVVTSPDPKEAKQIASAVASVLPGRITSIIEGTSAKVVDQAITASNPSSPSYTMNSIIGFLIGLILAVGAILLKEMFDVMIRTNEDIGSVCAYPLLATVPDMTAREKRRYAYYGRKRNDEHGTGSTRLNKRPLIGSEISFAAAESYKLLRTKLQFSFADDSNCRVLGVSSALSGEGKSLTSINLAYTLSQLDKKVLLIDCDMRRPTLAEKIGVHKKPGFSSYLTGQSQLAELLQPCGFKDNKNAFAVITAGENPPNPVELLSSDRMKHALEILRKTFDYIILDLPPVGEVSDAMAVAKQTDGMLLVVRQNICDRYALNEAIRQFDFIEAKILGVVFNGFAEQGGKGYYNKYYKGRYSTYSGSCEKARAIPTGVSESGKEE